MTEAITGWSVKDKIMGNAVYNEKDEKIGDINDVVLASDGKAAYFIVGAGGFLGLGERSEEHTSELQSLMRISYAVFCLKKKKHNKNGCLLRRYLYSYDTA